MNFKQDSLESYNNEQEIENDNEAKLINEFFFQK